MNNDDQAFYFGKIIVRNSMVTSLTYDSEKSRLCLFLSNGIKLNEYHERQEEACYRSIEISLRLNTHRYDIHKFVDNNFDFEFTGEARIDFIINNLKKQQSTEEEL